MTTYLMVTNNALNVPIMINNIIPPFIIWDSGLFVIMISKIHGEVPTKEHHSIYDATIGVHISKISMGKFLHFKRKLLTNHKIENCH